MEIIFDIRDLNTVVKADDNQELIDLSSGINSMVNSVVNSADRQKRISTSRS